MGAVKGVETHVAIPSGRERNPRSARLLRGDLGVMWFAANRTHEDPVIRNE